MNRSRGAMQRGLANFGVVIAVAGLILGGGCDRGVEVPREEGVLPVAGEVKREVDAKRQDTIAAPKKEEWNDKAREELRETLRREIRGELRLGRSSHERILESCGETYIDDPCPENERAGFVKFAAEELKRAAGVLDAEKAKWPAVTDCDRLDRAEKALRERGILLWQVSPCCNTCTMSEMPDRIAVIDKREPGFKKRVRGYAYFIDQTMPETLAEGTRLSLYLGYGWFSPDDKEVKADLYEKNALGVAREVRECLEKEGLKVDWEGDFLKKIGVTVEWLRRGRLE